jgi:hypothetical protein
VFLLELTDCRGLAVPPDPDLALAAGLRPPASPPPSPSNADIVLDSLSRTSSITRCAHGARWSSTYSKKALSVTVLD